MAEYKNQDPGLGTSYQNPTKRVINKDGSFNVHRLGVVYSFRNTYHTLVTMSWGRFMLTVFAAMFVANAVFAFIYTLIGVQHLSNVEQGNFMHNFMQSYFFSFQTFTTVGYGAIAPKGMLTNIVAATEAIIGFLTFALATGLLYGRFSKPMANLCFSTNAMICPYQDGWALMFRVANMRRSLLMDMEASVMCTVVHQEGEGNYKRQYHRLNLELSSIKMLPMNWTLVHKIDEDSPLFGKSPRDLQVMNFEVFVIMKGFDETFSQNVQTRYSYLHDELLWGAQFNRAYTTDVDGQTHFDIRKINDHKKLPRNELYRMAQQLNIPPPEVLRQHK